MIRSELLSTLELLNPALADDNLMGEVLQNVCFSKGTMYTYKESLGIFTPVENTENFAVNGKTFFKLLSKLSGKEVELSRSKDSVLIKSGSSKLKMPFIDEDQFMFEEPEDEEWDIIFDMDEDIIKGIKLCLLTAARDSIMSGFMGVAVCGGNNVNLYSCDGDGLSRYRLTTRKAPDVLHLVPNDFCEAVVRIAAKTKCNDGQLYVNGEWALAEFANNYRVFGRVIEHTPFDFEGHLDKAFKGAKEFVDIPDGMLASLERARVIGDQENAPTIISIKDGAMSMVTDSHIGRVEDNLEVAKAHPERQSSVAAKLVRKAVAECSTFALSKDCTVYKLGDEFTILFTDFEG